MNDLTVDKPAAVSGLSLAWEGIQKAKPGIRIREAARELGVSEAVLLATKIGAGIVRLNGPWPDLLKRFTDLGHVMSLTRNNSCILEHKGIFEKVKAFGKDDHAMATVIGPIETRVFFKSWHVAFAATEEKSGRVLKSIQVFDRSGEAITKIYLQENSNEDAYQQIISGFRSEDQSPGQKVYPAEKDPYSSAIDAEALLADWAALKDTHDFFSMLRKHQANRYQAIEFAAGRFSYQVDPAVSPKMILDHAASSRLPIMIFVGNRGNIQIHQDIVRTIRVLDKGHAGAERWLNVLDPDFNMHMKQNDIHTAWVVKKPTTDGVVTAVELFDKEREMIAQFFGFRKPGVPENDAWKALVEKLPAL